MSAYYNENDPFAAQWLRELITAGHIAPGEVDERSIEEVTPNDLQGYAQCHFFAGIGVWSYALRGAGWADDYPVWTGSCPCQSFSVGGQRGGFSDKRHLWPTWFRLIGKRKPNVVFGEQVASKDGLAWLDVVSADLEDAGYAIGSADLCAAGFKAPQQSQRLYFVAQASGKGLPRPVYNAGLSGAAEPSSTERSNEVIRAWRQVATSPLTLPRTDGTPLWMARSILHGYGNSLVAPVAQAFIEAYTEVTG